MVYLPDLQDLQLGYNELRDISPSSKVDTTKVLPSLTTLNLDSNTLSDWVSTMRSCSMIPNLRSLMLPSNEMASVPRRIDAPEACQPSLPLEQLALTDNPISSWSDVDALVSWFPKLYDLSISSESLASVVSSSSSHRNFIIARLPLLKKLNGTEVKERERVDAELFYLSWVSKNEQENDIEVLHPRWKELAAKYNISVEPSKPIAENLGSHMISVKIAKLQGPVSRHQVVPIHDDNTILRVLPTMTVKTFGMKLRKAMKLSSAVDPESLWLLLPSGADQAGVLRCFDADPLRDLAWSGVEEGSIIGLVCG